MKVLDNAYCVHLGDRREWPGAFVNCSDSDLALYSPHTLESSPAELLILLTSVYCRCELEPLAVDAGEVYYAREKAIHLILSNVGLVQARWQFMSLPGVMFNDPADAQSRPAPRWARISPSQVWAGPPALYISTFLK